MTRALQSIEAFDVIHNHSVFLWPTAAAAHAANRSRVPYVIAPRGMLVPELIERKSSFVKRAWIRLVEYRNFERAAAIHFTSQRELDDARDVGVPIPRAIVIPNGIDVRPLPDVPREDRTIVYLGRVNWKKRLDRLIESVSKIEGVRVIIAGNDEESLTPALTELAVRLGVAKRVEFVGPLYDDAKWNLLARAAVFVLPSLSENFGNVVLEAMAMETPVVLSPGVGLAEDVAAAEAGIVSDELAPAINELLSDPMRAAAMGKNGRWLVESQFTWDSVAARMEDAYRCLIPLRP